MSSVNDRDIVDFLNSCVEDINTDIERRTGKKSELKLSGTQMTKALKEFKGLEYFSDLKIEDLKFNDKEKNLLSVGYHLVGAIINRAIQAKSSVNNSQIYGELDLEQSSPIYTLSYAQIKNNYLEILRKINNQTSFKTMSLEDLTSIFKSIPGDYSTSLSQLLYKINNYTIFSNLQQPIPEDLIDRFIDAYNDLMTCFEKFLKIFYYIFIKVTGDTTTKFISIQNLSAFQLKDKLMENGQFKNNVNVLLDFTIIEWNAIKHGDVTKYPSQEIIEFRAKINDMIETRTLTHEEFIRKVRHLSSIIFLISRFTRLLYRLKLDQFSSHNSNSIKA